MAGEIQLEKMLKELNPVLNAGEYVFSTTQNIDAINRADTIGEFKEKEGITIIIERAKADNLNLKYDFVAAWITLSVHSSLSAVGLAAEVSAALTKGNISSNIIAGYYHDHLFVAKNDAKKAMEILSNLS